MGEFKLAAFAVVILLASACKSSLDSVERFDSEIISLDNFDSLPDSGCLNPSKSDEEVLEFPTYQNAEVDYEDSTESPFLLTDSGLGHLFLHSHLSVCPTEIAFFRSESARSAAGTQGLSTQSFGLSIARSLEGAKLILRAFEKSQDGTKLIFYFTNGTKKIVSIVRNGLLSTKDRIKLFGSDRYRSFIRSRVVTSDVLSPSQYEALLSRLSVLRAENYRKLGAWLSTNQITPSLKRKRPVDFVLASNGQGNTAELGPIFDLISKPKLIFRYLQDLEIDIAKRMAKGEKMEEALENLLTERERVHKFLPAYNLTGKDEVTGLTRDKLLRPALFRDFGFLPGSRHGVQIHRLQWNVIMRHIDQLPPSQKKIVASDLFVQFGTGVQLKAGNKKASWSDGWNELFDSYDDTSKGNFGRPETWRESFTDFLPILAGWP